MKFFFIQKNNEKDERDLAATLSERPDSDPILVDNAYSRHSLNPVKFISNPFQNNCDSNLRSYLDREPRDTAASVGI